MDITLQQMLCVDAVVSQGSIQAGALSLNKTHPTVITSLKNIELQLGFELFDRSGYRIALTEQGRSLYESIKTILSAVEQLKIRAKHLSASEEPELNIVIGDITPTTQSLEILRLYAAQNTFTKLNLLFENLQGPIERLDNNDADLIIHYIDKTDPRYEYKDFCKVKIIPVIAPDYFTVPINNQIKYSDIENYTQCIIRGTSTQVPSKNYFINNAAPQITVGDQYTKKQVILQRLAWGHMPLFLIEKELENGSLISIEGEFIKSNLIDIVVARLHSNSHGIMSQRLWQCF